MKRIGQPGGHRSDVGARVQESWHCFLVLLRDDNAGHRHLKEWRGRVNGVVVGPHWPATQIVGIRMRRGVSGSTHST